MTAYVATCLGNRVEVYSDGAKYDDAGTLLGTTCKVRQLAHFPAVIMTRGNVKFGEQAKALLSAMLGRFASFDAAIDHLTDWLGDQTPGGGLPTEIMIAGMSEDFGPVVYRFDTVDMVLHRSDLGMVSGETITAEQHSYFLHAPETGLRLMHQQRRLKVPCLNTGEEGYFVGAHVDRTTVDASGVRTITVHRWNDRVGQPIDPANGDATKTAPVGATVQPGMNRQQRRRAEREARRMAA